MLSITCSISRNSARELHDKCNHTSRLRRFVWQATQGEKQTRSVVGVCGRNEIIFTILFYCFTLVSVTGARYGCYQKYKKSIFKFEK